MRNTPKILSLLCCVLIYALGSAQSYSYNTVSSSGTPTNSSTTLVEQNEIDYLGIIFTTHNMEVSYPYFLNPNHGGLDIQSTTDISMIYVTEDAGYQNSVGYYTYTTGSPPTSESALTLHVIFPNIDDTQLSRGTTVDLGSFSSGTTVGFFLISDGWNHSATNQVNTSKQHLYSNYNLNDDGSTQINSKQNAIAYYSDQGFFVLGWDDQIHNGGQADKDYNDVIMYLNVSDATNATPPSNYPDASIPDNNPFPVELLKFDADIIDNNIRLNWSTASELNNDYFTIQHSTDGKSFTNITTISGNGTKNTISEYTYLHKTLDEGIHYYRLLQTDYNGQTHDKGVIAKVLANNLSFNVYNSSDQGSNTLNLEFSQATSGLIEIYSIDGSKIYSKNIYNRSDYKLYIPDKKGFYILRFYSAQGDKILTKKVQIL